MVNERNQTRIQSPQLVNGNLFMVWVRINHVVNTKVCEEYQWCIQLE